MPSLQSIADNFPQNSPREIPRESARTPQPYSFLHVAVFLVSEIDIACIGHFFCSPEFARAPHGKNASL